ncbi:MAG: DNA alkylation repair protein [Bacteroides sp.]|nr:DNA alkylation repair protein [Bacteroides sp.]
MTDSITAEEIEQCLLDQRNESHAKQLMRFFKTKPGEYGAGDMFMGLRAPQVRAFVKLVKGDVSFKEIEKLLYSQWHETRLAGFLLLVEEMLQARPKMRDKDSENKALRREEIARFYLRHARQANNWDLVDMSCPKILGIWLVYSPEHIKILEELAESDNLWEQRIAMVSNWMLIRHDIIEPTKSIATKLLKHPHDLIHKAVGWMLREMGKRDVEALNDYLDTHYSEMSRTTLRYAIEKLPENQRQFWLRRGITTPF